jgi:multiple sugar transport system ATP-binding protein
MAEITMDGLTKRYPDGFEAVRNMDLDIQDGEFVILVGPSGCGKSTALRMIAGLEDITEGELRIGGEVVNERAPKDRDVAMVFQNYALYPHMSVRDNMGFALKLRGLPKEEVDSKVREAARILDLEQHLDRKPSQLSGGQRQRVALGRAIVRTPRMFLMDEPLGHLEAYLRVQLRAEVRRLHERLGATTVYITHDQEEAAAVSDRIAVMQDGRLQQVGSLLDLLDAPPNRFVAEFIGDLPINMLPATLTDEGDGVALQVGDAVLPLSPEQSARLHIVDADALTLGVRPEDIELASEDGPCTLAGRVAVLEPQGDTSVVIADTGLGRVSAVVPSERAPEAGALLRYRFDLGRAHVFAADGKNLMHDGSGLRPGG